MTLPIVVPCLPKWADQALCTQTDPDAFYAIDAAGQRRAAAVCDRCPVRVPCLNWALDHNEQHGVWGGLSTPQRRALGPAHACEDCGQVVPTVAETHHRTVCRAARVA